MIVRKLEVEDLGELEESLLDINKEEIMAMRGVTVKELFMKQNDLLENSDVLVIDDEIVAVGGNMDTDHGHLVWLFGTDKLEKNKKPFAIVTSKRFEELKKVKDVLYSYVYSKNDLTKDWLRKLGFTIFGGEPIGQNGEVFHYFEWRKSCV